MPHWLNPVRLTITIDSFGVDPIEFPGGDIGKIAVCGLVNDLVVGAAKRLWLTAAFIIEEGCEIILLRHIVASMAQEAASCGIETDENALPLHEKVKGMCEGLGFDLLHLANEGALVLFVPESQSEAALAATHRFDAGRNACVIGQVVGRHPETVAMKTCSGDKRIVDMLVGE